MERCCCIILNYNDAQTVIKLLKQIISYKNLDEILIVDNCSTDNSIEELNQVKSKKITLLQTGINGGYGAGNNIGIHYAIENLQCQYVLVCNPDISFSDKLVETMLNVINSSKKVAVVSAIQLDINHIPISDFAWKIPSSKDLAFMTTRLGCRISNLHYSLKKINDHFINDVECVPGAMLMFDVDAFINIGGYDEEMFLYCEEMTIAYKLREHGYRTILLGNEYYVHEHSVSINKSISSKRIQLQLLFNNRILFMKKYLHASFFWILLTRILQKRRLYKLKCK